MLTIQLLQRLRDEEGDPKHKGSPVLTSYRDTNGVWTLGFGHNLEAHHDTAYPAAEGTTCTAEQAEVWLVTDALLAERAMLIRWPWMGQLPGGVYDVCIDLTFNMGVGRLAGFVHFLAALEAHDFNTAANELEDSLWFRQVGSRAPALVAQVRRGE